MSLMVCPSTPAAPAFALTSRHALRRMSSRYTLSKSAWNRRAALAFAARYSARWSSRVLSLVWLALTGIHPRLPPPSTPTKCGPFPPTRFCCPRHRRYYGPLRLPLRSPPFRASRACRVRRSQSTPTGWRSRRVSLLGRRRVSPVPTTTFPPFHVPYAAGFFGAAFPSASPLPWPSPDRARLGSRLLPCGHSITTRQTSLHAADWWVAPSLKKARPHASTPGSLRTPVGCYRGTWLLLRPDFHRLVVVNLRTHHDLGIVIGQRAGMPRCRPTRRANSGERYIRRIEAIK